MKEQQQAVITLYITAFQKELPKVLDERLGQNVKKEQQGEWYRWSLANGGSIELEYAAEEEVVKEQREGMYNFFAQVPCKDKRYLQQVLTQITQLKRIAGFRFLAEEDARLQKILDLLLLVAEEMNALVLYPTMDLFTAKGELLLSMDGSHALTEYGAQMETAADELADETDLAVFEEMCALFDEKGFRHPSFLLQEQIKRREAAMPSALDIAKRALALFGIALHCEQVLSEDEEAAKEAEEEFARLDRQLSILSCMQEGEVSFVQGKQADRQQALDMIGRYECAAILLWALGYGELYEMETYCDVQKLVDILQRFSGAKELAEKAKLKSIDEVYRQYVLYLYAQWHCMQAAMCSLPLHGIMEDAVVERYRALRWLCDGCSEQG